jgi:hypothetical protein
MLAHCAYDGGKQARSPRRARGKPLKPLRGECRAISGVTVVTTLVCYLHTAHEATGASRARHSLRPLFFRGRKVRGQNSRGHAARSRGCVFSLAPFLRGEGWGEGLYPRLRSRRFPLTRIAEFIIGRRFAPTRWQFDLSPQAGRGKRWFLGCLKIDSLTPRADSKTRAARTDARPVRSSEARRVAAGSACAGRAPLSFPASCPR